MGMCGCMCLQFAMHFLPSAYLTFWGKINCGSDVSEKAMWVFVRLRLLCNVTKS